MQLPLLNQSAVIQRFAAAAQAKSASVLDFTVGAVWRAIAEAQAAVALWLQFLIVLVLQTTRLSTSSGSDADTWVADWGVPRLAAVPASGLVTLSRISSTQPALIVPGVQIKTTDGKQTFTVITDTTNAVWSASAGAQPGYFLAAGVASATVPVVAGIAGSGGNIQVGTLSLLTSAIPGIDYASNPAPFSNGIDAETDAALRARFPLFIASRSRGTIAAYLYAIAALQQNLVAEVVEGAPGSGDVTVYVDDGTGAVPAGTVNACYTACDAVRAATVNLFVQGVSTVGASINAVLTYAPGADTQTVIANVSAAIGSYKQSIPVAGTMSFPRLNQVILDADAGVADISLLTINGAAASLTAAIGQRIEIASLTVA